MQKLLKPDFLLLPDAEILKNGALLVDDDGKIRDILQPGESVGNEIPEEYYEGLLCPAFVNAHCHLELSWMKDKIPAPNGLDGFIRAVEQLKTQSPEDKAAAMQEADEQMFAAGTAVCGDISNGSGSFAVKKASKIKYHTFIEVFGSHPHQAEKHFEHALALARELEASPGSDYSISPHAPYSVSMKLFDFIKAYAEKHKKTLSIHFQESPDENRFFLQGDGSVLERMLSYGIPLDLIPQHHKTTAEVLASLLPKEVPTLFVHNTFSGESDLEFLRKQLPKSAFCLCPQSNLRISKQLPDIDLMRRMGLKLCLGTDSLASAGKLSVLEEILILQEKFPHIPTKELLQWGTQNGAEALGFGASFGRLAKNKKPGIIHIRAFDGQYLLAGAEARPLIF